MIVKIATVPHRQQRYDTSGDWLWVENGHDPHTLEIAVSDTGDWRHAALLAIHEFAEAVLCRNNGISGEQADEWDKAYAGEGEPGDDPECPYGAEHRIAGMIEQDLAAALGVRWSEYEDAVEALS